LVIDKMKEKYDLSLIRWVIYKFDKVNKLYAPFLGALMEEIWIGTMALQNLQQYCCQTGNKLKEKSRDLNRNSSRLFSK
jgi:hypothetical protein